jgi:hypothetical protein
MMFKLWKRLFGGPTDGAASEAKIAAPGAEPAPGRTEYGAFPGRPWAKRSVNHAFSAPAYNPALGGGSIESRNMFLPLSTAPEPAAEYRVSLLGPEGNMPDIRGSAAEVRLLIEELEQDVLRAEARLEVNQLNTPEV